MQDMYETQFGIFDHVTNGGIRPMSSSEFHPGEEFTEGSQLEATIRMYLEKIKDVYGLSLIEYLNNPIDVNSMLHRISDEYTRKKKDILDGIQDDLKGKK